MTYFEDYVLGSTRRSHGRTVTEADIVLHAGQTGDFFPHHMDAEFAKTLPGGQRMAHGTLDPLDVRRTCSPARSTSRR